jgi:hypothetical protein
MIDMDDEDQHSEHGLNPGQRKMVKRFKTILLKDREDAG